MIAHGPAPSITIDQALRSTRACAERDRQLVAWCELAPDEGRAVSGHEGVRQASSVWRRSISWLIAGGCPSWR